MLRCSPLIAAAVLLAVCFVEGAAANSEVAQPLPALVARAQGSVAGLQAKLRGQLHVDAEGCLRVDERFVIWPHESRLARADDGRLQVSASGKTATVGADVVVLSGGYSDSAPANAERLTQSIPALCSGPYFMAFVLMEAVPQKRR